MSAFPVKIGPRGTSNAKLLRAIKAGRVPYPIRPVFEWRFRLKYTDFTPDSDTAQVLTLNTLRPRDAFPTNVRIEEGAGIYVHTPYDGTGISQYNIIVGDTADDNGLVTTLDVEDSTLGWRFTPSAAEWGSRNVETAYSPLVTIATVGGNIDAATQGDIEIVIPFSFLRTA